MAPFVGAGLAALTYGVVFTEDDGEEDVKEVERAMTADEESLAANIYNDAFAEDEDDGKNKKTGRQTGV